MCRSPIRAHVLFRSRDVTVWSDLVNKARASNTWLFVILRDNGPEGMEPDGIIEVSPTVLIVFYHVVERSLLCVRVTVVLGDSAGSIHSFPRQSIIQIWRIDLGLINKSSSCEETLTASDEELSTWQIDAKWKQWSRSDGMAGQQTDNDEDIRVPHQGEISIRAALMCRTPACPLLQYRHILKKAYICFFSHNFFIWSKCVYKLWWITAICRRLSCMCTWKQRFSGDYSSLCSNV